MLIFVFQRSLVHFWRRRHDPGILFLFFDELFHSDDAAVGGGAVRRIAEFVGAGHGGLHVSDDLLKVPHVAYFVFASPSFARPVL
jgi:hypothetical protein